MKSVLDATSARLQLLLVLLLLFIAVVSGDISDLNPPAGSCLCLTTTNVNVRGGPCGTVIGSSGTGDCHRYEGQKIGCWLSSSYYEYFEVNFNDQSGWIAGNFMNVGSDSSCGSVEEPDEEFRALFIATAWNVDWPLSSSDSVSSQQQQLIDYVTMMSSTNMNAIMFQVRPAGDAFYQSDIEPWSKYLTGTQGQAPSPLWDPLSFLITEAHSRGIEVHAWLNPYRANLAPNWNGLAPNHMANVYRQYAYVYSNYLWMDPGASVIVDHLVNVIADIMARYDVDGIHFDDYFYPYNDGTEFPDSSTYNDYLAGGGSMSRDNWRRDNVNTMVERVYNYVHGARPGCKFSISPFGIYRPGHITGMPSPPISGMDPYSELYADAKLWLQNGWVDFMAPQLYWEIEPPAQSYPTLLDWWLTANTAQRHIYAANGVYKIDTNGWPVSEIENQVDLSRDSVRRSELSLGNIHYSAKYFRDNYKSITDLFRSNVYTKPATIPAMSWLNLRQPGSPTDLQLHAAGETDTITWRTADADSGSGRWWVVARNKDDEYNSSRELQWSTYAVLPHDKTSLHVEPGYHYAIRAANAAWESGPAVKIHVA